MWELSSLLSSSLMSRNTRSNEIGKFDKISSNTEPAQLVEQYFKQFGARYRSLSAFLAP